MGPLCKKNQKKEGLEESSEWGFRMELRVRFRPGFRVRFGAQRRVYLFSGPDLSEASNCSLKGGETELK